ncbi:glycosyltransferase family protein [Ornithinicoccus hortensis]|uniref:Spore maturation protein CgeB n=1 Tax=Ornithinicoccus hortensis TaxID=82346 RepID=A0A542YWQ9_9MICO|nr:glycosyltransferase [Ornithinicoccus hortensis]TQL48943.1 spore maturation protein CgeB [Ornithinicoccus hortensis]TQL52517.1 spore maturation protein CgeB [Ornithinicoccus hortensis]
MGHTLSSVRTQLWHLRKGGIRQWRTNRARVRAVGGPIPTPAREEAVSLSRDRQVTEWPLPERPPRRTLRVGVILDDFSELAFGYEWDQTALTPSGWREEMSSPPDLLFVESAWAGSGGAWRYALTGPNAPSQALRDLVAWCRDQDVPTVFWNKEDPVHFEDFIDTASLFDHVLTTDDAVVADYQARLGHERVSVMPFGAASWVHNPMRPAGHARRDVAFAGTYFAHKYPERREQMELLIGAAAAVSRRLPTGLEIFSRFRGGDERYQFPSPMDEYVVGSLSYRQMLTAYREFKAFLNVNSVTSSKTMCPRRVLELAACATPVVSTPAPAIAEIFPPDEVLTVTERDQAEWTIRALAGNVEWGDRLGHLAARRVLASHTYRHRVDGLLEAVGLAQHRVEDPSISVICSTRRPEHLRALVQTVAKQREVSPQLVLLTHGFEPDFDVRTEAVALGLTDVVLITARAEVSLGQCLNQCIDAADGQVVAKMDDDDLYSEHYLADQLRALDFSGADVVGKHAHHMLITDMDALVLRFGTMESRFTHLVMGPTLVMPRDVASEFRFADRTRGEDTDLLGRIVAAGGKVYASDRYGFVQVRRPDGHTWDASHMELLANGRVVAYGSSVEHVLI